MMPSRLQRSIWRRLSREWRVRSSVARRRNGRRFAGWSCSEASMKRQDQIGLLKQLLHYVETGTTALADAPWYNDVSVYADPAHLAREQRLLFRRYPML